MSGRSLGAFLGRGRAQHPPERRVHVVVVPADDLPLDERVGGRLPALDICEELTGGEEVRRELAGGRGAGDYPQDDHRLMADRFPTAANLAQAIACTEHAGTVSQSEYVR